MKAVSVCGCQRLSAMWPSQQIVPCEKSKFLSLFHAIYLSGRVQLSDPDVATGMGLRGCKDVSGRWDAPRKSKNHMLPGRPGEVFSELLCYYL